MELKRALEIIEQANGGDSFRKNQVAQGLLILARYAPDQNVEPEYDHDIIWASAFEETVARMNEEDVLEMGCIC